MKAYWIFLSQEYVLGWDVDTGRISHPENTILIIRLYLQAVLQQSECYETSKTMVQQGLLTILWRVVHAFPNEVGLSTLCTQIVANLSSHPPLLVHIFQSGERNLVHLCLSPCFSFAKSLLRPTVSFGFFWITYLYVWHKWSRRLDWIACRISALKGTSSTQSGSWEGPR